jgi:nucleoside-diphosphate-sugar epimerase
MRRFSQVSTVAVAGHRSHEIVSEDASIDWNRSDYDPYARTKKFCEHMVRELLPDVSRTVFRPSIVLGDSRRAETTQFDMVRAFVFLAGLPVLPFRPSDRIDIVPVDYVAESVVALHQKSKPMHEIYRTGIGENGALVLARARTSIFFRGELAGGISRKFRPQRIIAESFHAVSGVGHCV